MSTRTGALVAFEGPDGVGKTTLVQGVRDALVDRDFGVSVLSFPGRTPGSLGALVYGLHHEPQRYGVTHVLPAALQLLHVAAHLDVIDREIRPRIAAGEIVLLDRYWWSTWVYGVLSGINHSTLRTMIELEREHWGELHPAAVFLIRRSIDSIPHAERADFRRRDEEYRAIAATQQDVVELSNATTVEAAVEQVLRELDTRLQQRLKPRCGVGA